MNLIKGHGGALLREKIVASVRKRLVIVADDSELIHRLAEKIPVPAEVIPFGWQATARQLSNLGARPSPPESRWRSLFERRWTLHPRLRVRATVSAEPLARELDHIVGLVEQWDPGSVRSGDKLPDDRCEQRTYSIPHNLHPDAEENKGREANDDVQCGLS